jgi:hypothetical protein
MVPAKPLLDAARLAKTGWNYSMVLPVGAVVFLATPVPEKLYQGRREGSIRWRSFM